MKINKNSIKTFILFFIIALCSRFSFGQTEQIKVTLKWNPALTEKISDDKTIHFANFDACSYNELMLPLYQYKSKYQSEYFTTTASISNEVSRIADPSEILNIENLEKINSDYSIDAKTLIENKKAVASVSICPIRRNKLGQIEVLTSFSLTINRKTEKKSIDKVNKYASNSVLSSGIWFKMSAGSNGIYKITYNDLVNLGIDPTLINPKKIRIFNNGAGMLPEKNGSERIDDLKENAIYVSGENDEVFNTSDYILFYGMSPNRHYFSTSDNRFNHINHLYSDETFYFLNIESEFGKRITPEASTSENATNEVNSFDEIVWWDKDSINLIKSGREWYGRLFDNITTYSFAFNTPDPVSSQLATFETRIAARSTTTSSFTITINGNSSVQTINSVNGSYTTDYAFNSKFVYQNYLSSNTANITLKYNKPTNNSSAIGWINDININYRRNLIFHSGQMHFRDRQSSGTGKISNFTLNTSGNSISVWDVSNTQNVRQVEGVLSGNNFTFRLATDSLKEFVAFDGSYFYSPALYGRVSNQNLHSLSNVQMVIVTAPEFESEAERLANHHRTHDGMNVSVLTPQVIYNEFSCGSQDISAIRDFMRMLYEKANTAEQEPRYLLLFGDGSYDFKNRLSRNTNFIPTYQSSNSTSPTSSFVSDDFFALLDSTEGVGCAGALDIGVGRFPVGTLQQARDAVDKVLRYVSGANVGESGKTSHLADWRNTICFIADDEDNNLHISQADAMANKVKSKYPEMNINKIYLDSYQQESNAGGQRYPDATDAFTRQVEKSALIINYTGHGGELGLTHERVLGINDIINWENYYNMPIFMTATCEFSRWDDPAADKTSAGEYVFLNNKGGGVALFSTTRLVFASSNYTLNTQFYNYVFESINNAPPRLGDIIRLSKNNSNTYPNDRNFSLLGDPALMLGYPLYNVTTTTINQLPADTICDTIKALNKVTIHGYISDQSGTKLTSFNGTIYPTVYDKSTKIRTLGNDSDSPIFNFDLQRSILYKGKSKVTNGDFTFSFIIPKDISYNYGVGKISYYAENGEIDANGYFDKIIIGGSDTSAVSDNTGPKVELFLNNENFVFGGLTNENPVLLAYVSDSNGINTVGNGIGHDITAILDDNTDKSIILNDYYQADLDSYQKGTIRYELKDLSEGRHSLKLKTWDIYNNSSDVYTEFIVAKASEVEIDHVFNYPNPFTSSTGFYLNHNQPNTKLNVSINIYTITGRVVRTIQEEVETSGNQISPIHWDGKDNFGDKLAKGVYVYEIKVESENGSSANKIEKLVIL